jgi:DnaJ-class molecular chaperone with C-terminal Zn finger domain
MPFFRLILFLLGGYWFLQHFLKSRLETKSPNTDFIDVTMGAFAKFAKADGRVSEQEIAAVERIIATWTLGPAAARHARESFRAAKDKKKSFEDYIGEASDFTASVRYIFFDCLVALACAEPAALRAKHGMLLHAARVLGFPRDLLHALMEKHLHPRTSRDGNAYDDWQRARARAHGGGNRHENGTPNSSHHHTPLDADYALLGAPSTSTDAEIKKAYRKKAMELHPDRLQAQGLPPEMVKAATESLARVNTAYERICRERGMK